MADSDIYDDPSSNEIDFKKLRNRFQEASDNPVSRPPVKQKPRESIIAQRIKNLQANKTKTLQGRESVVSILPPNSNTVPQKTGEIPVSSGHTKPSLPKKANLDLGETGTFAAASAKLESVLGAKHDNLRNKSAVSTNSVLVNSVKDPISANRISKTKRATLGGKENYLPEGLSVGMIVKGNDGKSYKLLALPTATGDAPPPPQPPQIEVDLSRWMNEDEDFYDDVEIVGSDISRATSSRGVSLRPGTMRPVSEILPMTEEEEERFEKSQKNLRSIDTHVEEEELYDDTIEEELYDDVGATQEEVYEDI